MKRLLPLVVLGLAVSAPGWSLTLGQDSVKGHM